MGFRIRWSVWGLPVMLIVLAVVVPVAGRQAGALGRQTFPVVPCPIPPGELGPLNPTRPPPVTVPPAPVTVPPGAQLFGTGSPGPGYVDGNIAYSLAPARFSCAAHAGGDGAFYMGLASTTPGSGALSDSFSPGGIGLNFDLPCPYIPAIHVADVRFRGGVDNCTRPDGETVTQVATGDAAVLAALVSVPPGIKDSALNTPDGRPQSTLAVLVATVSSDNQVQSQEADCALPADQHQVCVAALEYFVVQSLAAHGLASVVPAILAAIAAAAPEPPVPPEEPVCQGNGDLELEREINKTNSPISIPENGIALPAGLPGAVTVSFVPGEVKVCKNNLSPILNSPAFVAGELSLSASDSAGQPPTHGPFVYSAPATAWTSAPGAPPQVLSNTFPPPKIEFSVNPQLVLLFKTGGPTPGIQIASAKLNATFQTFTLVSNGGALLQVALGPTLEVSVTIDKDTMDKAVEEELAAKGATDAATKEAVIEDVANQVASDAVVGIKVEVSAYYQVIVPVSDEQALFVSVRNTLSVAFTEDAAITNFLPAAAEAVPADFAAADAAAVDAGMAGDTIAVGGIEEFLIFLVL